MDFSKDNLKGIVLALISCGFIGASFIVKKKGLKKAAAASGVLGVLVSRGASLVVWHDHNDRWGSCKFCLVTPLGALSIIISAVLTHFMLKEKLHWPWILGCVMCVVGSIIIVIHAPRKQPISSVQEIWTMATQPGSVIILVIILVFYFAPQCGNSNVVVITGICSLMGSLSDWDGQSAGNIIPETCGFVVVLTGTILLHVTKDFKRSSSFREKSQFVGGSYTPFIPFIICWLMQWKWSVFEA